MLIFQAKNKTCELNNSVIFTSLTLERAIEKSKALLKSEDVDVWLIGSTLKYPEDSVIAYATI